MVAMGDRGDALAASAPVLCFVMYGMTELAVVGWGFVQMWCTAIGLVCVWMILGLQAGGLRADQQRQADFMAILSAQEKLTPVPLYATERDLRRVNRFYFGTHSRMMARATCRGEDRCAAWRNAHQRETGVASLVRCTPVVPVSFPRAAAKPSIRRTWLADYLRSDDWSAKWHCRDDLVGPWHRIVEPDIDCPYATRNGTQLIDLHACRLRFRIDRDPLMTARAGLHVVACWVTLLVAACIALRVLTAARIVLVASSEPDVHLHLVWLSARLWSARLWRDAVLAAIASIVLLGVGLWVLEPWTAFDEPRKDSMPSRDQLCIMLQGALLLYLRWMLDNVRGGALESEAHQSVPASGRPGRARRRDRAARPHFIRVSSIPVSQPVSALSRPPVHR